MNDRTIPAAPAGYRHLNPPTYGQPNGRPFINAAGTAVVPSHSYVAQHIDNGRRWIVEKIPVDDLDILRGLHREAVQTSQQQAATIMSLRDELEKAQDEAESEKRNAKILPRRAPDQTRCLKIRQTAILA